MRKSKGAELACPGALHFQLVGRDELLFPVVDDGIAADADTAASFQADSATLISNVQVPCIRAFKFRAWRASGNFYHIHSYGHCNPTIASPES